MSAIELRQVRRFHLVADELHFGRAARIAGASPSALSQEIKRLEDVLGVKLFERNRIHVALTAAGDVFRERTRGLLEHLEAAAQAAREAGYAENLILSVGFTELALSTRMSQVLRAVKDKHPAVDIRMHEGRSTSLQASLLDGSLHLAFLALPVTEPAIEVIQVGSVPLYASVPEGHRLAKRDVIEFKDLDGEPLILFGKQDGAPMSHILIDALKAAGIEPRIERYANSRSAAVMLTAAGVGIGFLGSPMSDAAPAGVKVLPLGSPRFEAAIAMAWAPMARSAPISKVVMTAVKAAGDKLAP
ncbi:MAG TPA: LysR family transcriptional regulator [Caulobacteraceae bacterium]|nr:LysR family transcriptional regulator [Caulobacteraceae bacterium]